MSTKEIEKHLTAGANMRKRDIMIANFLGGIAWGLGTVLGATVIVALLLALLRGLGYIPVIGDLVTDVRENINFKRMPTQNFDENRVTPPPAPTYYIVPAPTPTPTPEASASASPKP